MLSREKDLFDYNIFCTFIGNNDITEVLYGIRQWRQLSVDVYLLTRAMGMPDPTQRIKKMHELSELQKFHDILSDRIGLLRKMDIENRYRQPFPSPPIQGDKNIEPIENVYDLIEEGIVMHNCIGGYIDKIMAGRSFIYKVKSPERATLEVIISNEGICRIGDIRLICNKKTSIDTSSRVRKWVEYGNKIRKNCLPVT